VISTTLRFGSREGFKVACAPLFTDLPILFGCSLLLAKIESHGSLMASVAGLGAIFLGRMAWSQLRFKGTEEKIPEVRTTASFREGILANLLNPAPYLFWLGVGTPLLHESAEKGWSGPVGFVTALLGTLVLTKVFLALLVRRSMRALSHQGYIWIVRGAGVLLLLFACSFALSAVRFLGGGTPAP
jgi:threonine/homoserine/homoserine lactone efflux protein